jgi:hypothetical protein
MPTIKRHDDACVSVHCRFEHQVVADIRQDRTPQVRDANWLEDRGERKDSCPKTHVVPLTQS